MMIKKIIVSFLRATAVMGCCPLAAQEFGLTYTTELQTDFKKGTNWVNLLRTDFSLPIGEHFRADLATISTAKTREDRLVDDLLTFSNIEEGNIPLALSILGLNCQIGKSSLFFGIRNLNEDYFTSPCTSLFTNSSCGIFPTISTNYPIANYPVASVGLDYKLELKHWTFESSLYNGTGYRNFTGRENVFRICPKSDGILSVTSINYQNNDNGYYFGFALHDGLPVGDEEGSERQETAEKKKELNTVLWGYAEQRIFPHVHMLLQYSISPTEKKGCRNYAGAGFVFQCKNTTGGIFTGYADFKDKYEWVSELTWQIPCWKNGYIQPTLHFIKNNQEKAVIGLLRFGYTI